MAAVSALPNALSAPRLRLVPLRSAPTSTADDTDRLPRWQAYLAAALIAVALVLGALAPWAPASGAASAETVVAVEGDTMWSIAVAHAPAGEAAIYVEHLVEANGTSMVAPGQHIVLPSR